MIALDIETAPGVGFEEFEDAALDPHRNRITTIALSDGERSWNVSGSGPYPPGPHIYHSGKFDLKTLITKCSGLTVDDLGHDTMLMAIACVEKIPETWLEDYEAQRKVLNQAAGKEIHRYARGYSLKTLAPYFLGVEPFWEVEDHADEEYACKDALYTWRLFHYFEPKLKAEGSWDFYEKKLLPWARMLLEAELNGMAIDFPAMGEAEQKASIKAKEAKEALDDLWAPAYAAYQQEREIECAQHYIQLTKAAQAKLKDQSIEAQIRTAGRYDALWRAARTKIEPLSLDSPKQLSWLLKDHLGLDITTFDGNDESTGKPILSRLAAGRKDIQAFVEYREQQKLVTAFFPSYRKLAWHNKIHTNFNIDITRTGRLSSNGPNLQQIAKKLMYLFIAELGETLVYRDVSAVEPRLVAYLTEDPVLCEIFIRGTDFHSENVRIFCEFDETDQVIKSKHAAERDLSKEVGLSLMYGASWRRLHESSNKRGFPWTVQKCKYLTTQFRKRYERVFEFKQELEAQYIQQGFVRNIFGRACTVPPDRLHMTSLNTLIQSSGSDILLESTRKAITEAREKGLTVKPRLFIHDAAVLSAPTPQAGQLYDILGNAISSWQLPTQYGNIPMKSEGKVCQAL